MQCAFHICLNGCLYNWCIVSMRWLDVSMSVEAVTSCVPEQQQQLWEESPCSLPDEFFPPHRVPRHAAALPLLSAVLLHLYIAMCRAARACVHVCVHACARVFSSLSSVPFVAPSCACCGGVDLTHDIVTVSTFNECVDRVPLSPFVKQVGSRQHLALNPTPPASKQDALTGHHCSTAMENREENCGKKRKRKHKNSRRSGRGVDAGGEKRLVWRKEGECVSLTRRNASIGHQNITDTSLPLVHVALTRCGTLRKMH